MTEVIQELIDFIKENSLSPFNKNKTTIRQASSIYKTVDAKAVHSKVISKISDNFNFSDTSCLFSYFNFDVSEAELLKRQEFFSNIGKLDNSFMRNIRVPRISWKPKYDVIVVTEEEDTFLQLKKLNCPVIYINSPDDVRGLESSDIIQVIDCDNLSGFLEQLPQTVFLDSIDEVYPERYLEILSGWKENLELLDKNQTNEEIKKLVDELKPFLRFLEEGEKKKISLVDIENGLMDVNSDIQEKIKQMTLTGNSIFEILSKGKMPEEFSKIIEECIRKTNLPLELFNLTIPVSVDEKELARFIKLQNANEFTNLAEAIKKNSSQLKQVSAKLERLADLILIFDFISGVSRFLQQDYVFPKVSEDFRIMNSKNIFLDRAQPVSFFLDSNAKCSVLTGANSGGKTTLIEHIIQLISLFRMGLPVSGEIKIPMFSEVYYFAKNKGSMSKGAFETLLTQMAGIVPGTKTLILADELEAVTEPGVAAEIVCATSRYFIGKECFLVIATHLGKEIQKSLPERARIDGIEAKGLDENNELIVDHNPVLGRLANSTPELIVERLAKTNTKDYFNFLFNYLKKI